MGTGRQYDRRLGRRATRRRLILASSSPQRRQLLRQAGYRFQVKPPPPIEGSAIGAAPTPGAYVESAAYLKAVTAIEAHRLGDGLVLGADTAVELGGRIIGKPRDEADARRILSELAGSQHRVLTGLALVEAASGLYPCWTPAGGRRERPDALRHGPVPVRRALAHAVTIIRMRPMSDAEIDAYVATGAGLGKAGAYALQSPRTGGTSDRYVESIEGSFTNVVGLPMELLEQLLKGIGYDPQVFRTRGA